MIMQAFVGLLLDMPFAFCTREKYPWCEFAETVHNGPSTTLLKEVIISL